MTYRRETILLTIRDMVIDLVHTDRRLDDELPQGEIEAAVADGVVTLEEMVDRFQATLAAQLSLT